MLQELISNIIKHSEATSASIEIIKDTVNLNIKVKDNEFTLVNDEILNEISKYKL